MAQHLARQTQLLDGHEAVMTSMDPKLVLNRGYAWLTTQAGQPLTRASQAQSGQALIATLPDGEVELTVR